MKTKKAVAVIMLTALILSACHKVERISYETVSVIITDAYYRPAFVTPKTDSEGKLTGYDMHDAEGIITVAFDGYEYRLYRVEYYYEYYDEIGKSVSATLKIIEYDDGRTKRNIVALGTLER